MEEKNLNVPQEAVELTDEQMEAVAGGLFSQPFTKREAADLIKLVPIVTLKQP